MGHEHVELGEHGCETGFLTLKEERRINVFENHNRRRVVGHNRHEYGERKMLFIKELHRLYRSYNADSILRWAGDLARIQGGSAFKTSKTIGKIPLGRPGSGFEGNIKL